MIAGLCCGPGQGTAIHEGGPGNARWQSRWNGCARVGGKDVLELVAWKCLQGMRGADSARAGRQCMQGVHAGPWAVGGSRQ